MPRRRKRMIDRPIDEAAQILIDRHGARAELVASNRADDARTEGTAWFYERVMEAISKKNNAGNAG